MTLSPQPSRLLAVGLAGSLGLFGSAAIAQTDAASPVAEPAPAVAAPAPAAPAVPPPAAPAAPAAPAFSPPPAAPAPPVEVVIPSDLVPAAIPTAPSSVPEAPAATAKTPADYGTVFVDPTQYDVGSTAPSVVFSERGSGCQFSVAAGQGVPAGACAQPAPTATAQAAPGEAGRGPSLRVGPVTVSAAGVQISGGTTTAGREYYSRAARPIVNLQLGQKFIFPLSLPAQITSLFGWRWHPISGDRRFHSGTDLGAPLGTPVVATQAGRVALSDFLGGYGLTVILRHQEGSDDLESRYAHLSQLLVQPGEWVEQGDVIGLVGSTGNSTGPHLHFELRQLTGDGWVALNPDLLIQQTLASLLEALNSPLQAMVQPESDAPANLPASEPAVFRPAQPTAH